jgi:hypothetical protein
MANVIESFVVALGFKVDPAGAADLKKQTNSAKESLLSLGNAVKAFAAGYLVKGIAGISDTFEQNTIAISGFLEALDFSKPGQGMEDAEKTLANINAAAAKLPGEAEEYIEVFRAGLPVLKGAMPGGSIGAMTDFTNRFTAIGKTLQVDAPQIGRDLSLMLGPKGRAGGHVLTFQRMLPFIRQLQGHAQETSESFNAMTQPKRLQLLQDALANPALSAMLDRSANSFDAMLGAAKSMVKTLIRLSTASLFKGAKQGLDAIRAIFVDDGGKLTANGETFVAVLQQVGYGIARMVRLGAILVKTFLHLASSSLGVKIGLLSIVAAVIGLQKVLTFGLLGAILLIIEDLHTFYEGGQSITGLLAEKFPAAVAIIEGVLGALGVAFVALQAKSIASAIASAVAWTAANLPFILMLASISALIVAFGALIANWEKVKATMKFLPSLAGAKVVDSVQKLFGGAAGGPSNEDMVRAGYGKQLEDIDFKKGGRLTPGAIGPAFSSSGMARTAATPPALSSTPAAPVWQKWDPGMGGTVSSPVTNHTTINVNGARDPKAVADEVAKIQQRTNRGVIRTNQKAHAY